MMIVYIERTGTHEEDSPILEAKGLRAAQDASHELIGRAQSKTQRVLRQAGWVFQQEPAKVRLFHFCGGFFGSAGLNRNEARNFCKVLFRNRDELRVLSSLMWDWRW
ncbi:MAG: hypothetical protein WCC89_19730, partial [Candidatus Sulfotelmatobacter sp.]